tara:strand:+ start:1921 stop:2583 length:663 start_codon:yes stop_codon:yes gene_type:complete
MGRTNKDIQQVNMILVSTLTTLYTLYLLMNNNYRNVAILLGVYGLSYMVSRRNMYSQIMAVIVAFTLNILLQTYETWSVYRKQKDIRNNNENGLDHHSYPFDDDMDVVEGFKSKSKKRKRGGKRRRRHKKQNKLKNINKPIPFDNFDKDDYESSYVDLGSSFLDAYKSLTPKQIEKMSGDTRALMGHQKKLIETLDNLGPVIKGGKKIMEQFKHYFKDEI